MFKNLGLQVKMVNTKKKDDNSKDADTFVDPEQISKIATDFTVRAIGAVGVVIAANKVLNTICDIAVIAAKAKFK